MLGPKPLSPKKMAQFMDAPIVTKTLENLKLEKNKCYKDETWHDIVYLHKTLHLTKDLGVNYREWQGVAKKPLKKVQKIAFWGSISWNFQ